MNTIWGAAAIGLAIALVGTALMLPLLRRLQLRQHAYEDAPQSHQAKTGTPTMGGIAFVLASLPLLLLHGKLATALTAMIAACAAVGFLDDFLGIRSGRNRGLRARTKFLMTALIAVVFLRAIDASTGVYARDAIFTSAWYTLMVPHWLWLLLGIATITATIHAVNLTDGLDGLATGVVLFPMLVLAIVAAAPPANGTALAAAGLLAGACAGFLIFNRYPARVFMGDTGSLALGAALSGIAILTGEMLLLILIGGVLVLEALSVIAQVAYFKSTGGKRIFRMSPLHHHFELEGHSEHRVTAGFWIASAALGAIGLAVVR